MLLLRIPPKRAILPEGRAPESARVSQKAEGASAGGAAGLGPGKRSAGPKRVSNQIPAQLTPALQDQQTCVFHTQAPGARPSVLLRWAPQEGESVLANPVLKS